MDMWCSVSWYGGLALCKLLSYLKVQLTMLASFVLVCLSVDRCVNLLFPLYCRVTNCLSVRSLLLGSVALASALAIPQVTSICTETSHEMAQCITF